MSSSDEQMVLAHFIVSDDVERSRRFYTDVLGGKTVISGEPNDHVTYVALANRIALSRPPLHKTAQVSDVFMQGSYGFRLGVRGADRLSPFAPRKVARFLLGKLLSERFTCPAPPTIP